MLAIRHDHLVKSGFQISKVHGDPVVAAGCLGLFLFVKFRLKNIYILTMVNGFQKLTVTFRFPIDFM